ncbi:MAG: penicillin-binding protein activator LpoB [Treponema sp.]|jgi:hypothetical protein|nr:penicillin-binding protein activator LpoB [Treponema sp.]
MKKFNILVSFAVLASAIIISLAGCATTAAASAPQSAASQTAARAPASFYDQLDPVIEKTFINLTQRLNSDLRIALLPPGSSDKGAANYVFDELYAKFINASYTMPDRANIDKAIAEIEFGMTGMVSDDTAASIGHLLGAQVIVFGDMPELGSIGRQRIVFRALEVETGRMLGISTERF